MHVWLSAICHACAMRSLLHSPDTAPFAICFCSCHCAFVCCSLQAAVLCFASCAMYCKQLLSSCEPLHSYMTEINPHCGESSCAHISSFLFSHRSSRRRSQPLPSRPSLRLWPGLRPRRHPSHQHPQILLPHHPYRLQQYCPSPG